MAATTCSEWSRYARSTTTQFDTSEEETGAEHCQHDNPTMGQELMLDWLCDVFRIDQRQVAMLPG